MHFGSNKKQFSLMYLFLSDSSPNISRTFSATVLVSASHEIEYMLSVI